MNAAKRRRLNESTSTLSRPFKSPMRVDVKTSTQAVDTSNAAESTCPTAAPSTNETQSPATVSRTSVVGTPLKDPSYIALQRQHSALQHQVKQLHIALDTTQQAVKIAGSDADEELDVLIERWTTAAREAAEELFRGAKDRVNTLGGVGVWKAREREHVQRRAGNSWDDVWREAELDEDELTEEQKEARESLKKDMQKYRAQRKEEEEEEEGGKEREEQDDQSFTMDMMLKQLNIDLEVIGFDKASQSWV